MFYSSLESIKISFKSTKSIALFASFLLVMLVSTSNMGTLNAQNCTNCVAGPTSGNFNVNQNSNSNVCFTQNATLNNMIVNGLHLRICIAPGVTVIIENNINLNGQSSLELEIGGTLQFNQSANLDRPLTMNILAGGEFRAGPTGNGNLTISGTSATNLIVNDGLFKASVLGFGNGTNQVYNNGTMQIGANINISGTTTFRNQSDLLIQNSYNNNSTSMFINCAYMQSSNGYNLGGGRVINTGNFVVSNGSIDFGTGALFENYGTVTHTGSSINFSGLTSKIYNEGLFSATSIQNNGTIEGPALNSGKVGYIEITGQNRITMNQNVIGPNLDFTFTQGTANLGDGRPNTTKPGNGQNNTAQNNNRQYVFQNFNGTFVNVETISFACRQGTTNTCAAPLVTTGKGCPDIFGNFTPVAGFNLSGIVYNDVNGGAINGFEIQSASSIQLYVSVINSNNDIVQTSTVDANGVYSFTALPSGNYSVVLHTTASGSITANIPTPWVHTAEGYISNGDGNPNGIFIVNLSANETNTAFAIQRRPNAGTGNGPITQSAGINPGDGTFLNVPRSLFAGSDQDNGNIKGIKLNNFPSNTNRLLFRDTTYYPNQSIIPVTCPTSVCLPFPNSGLRVLLNNAGDGFEDQFSFDPSTGALEVIFPYQVVDDAGFTSSNTAFSTLNFNNAPLSVGCSDFTAQLQNGSVELIWVTASETQNRGFSLQRSSNGVDFQEIAWIAGNGTTTNINTYNFIDQNPENGRNYYRLIAEEQSGKLTQVCKIITAEVTMNQQRIEIYPNPVSSLVFFKNFGVQISNVEVINLSGSTVSSFNGNISEINVTQLPSGVYTLRISTVHGVTVHKLVVTR